jgi:hypothetical protein
VQARGYQPAERRYSIAAGGAVEDTISLVAAEGRMALRLPPQASLSEVRISREDRALPPPGAAELSLPPATYQVSLVSRFWPRAVRDVEVRPGSEEPVVVDFASQPGQPYGLVELSVEPAGAAIDVLSGSVETLSQADRDGRRVFVLRSQAAGGRVLVGASGRASRAVPLSFAPLEQRARAVQLGPGDSTVRFTLRTADGVAPAAGVSIALNGPGGSREPHDRPDRLEFQLAPGRWRYSIDAPGYARAEGWIEVRAGKDQEVTVDLNKRPPGTAPLQPVIGSVDVLVDAGELLRPGAAAARGKSFRIEQIGEDKDERGAFVRFRVTAPPGVYGGTAGQRRAKLEIRASDAGQPPRTIDLRTPARDDEKAAPLRRPPQEPQE